ncbi:RDD family protein [Kribbella sp. GL6]|uniref:RDD family protein n=1 Tax=Kribbella sp. GL6 TaxID=3419765 RepID=UPI003D015572
MRSRAFRRRIAALLIDYLLICAWLAVLAGAALVVYLITGSLPNWLDLVGTAGAETLGFVLLVLPVGIYLFTTEASARHATVGKRALHLQVTDPRTGTPPTRRQILVRTVVKLIPWELAHFFIWQLAAAGSPTPAWITTGLIAVYVLPLTYLAMVAFRKDARGPHDLAANTAVGPS